jgi:DNA-binding SARP family transcriptional activator
MSRLEIQLLGPTQVRLDGQPITGYRADTAQALLAYLAMHAGTPCRRTSLAGLLWSDYDESSALTNLRQALRRLRTAIGDSERTPPFLQVTRTTIALNPKSDHWLDVDAFSEALDAVRSHAHRRPETCAVCAERLAEAVELYRGEFLAGFSLDSALFEEWMVVERERLHGQALQALGHLAAYHEAQGEFQEAVRYARRQLELEPWREEAHRALMRALALSGQRSAALAQYEACREVLREELGVEPAEETRALYERIRDGEDLTG